MGNESDAAAIAAIAATATLRSEVACFGIAFSFGDALALTPVVLDHDPIQLNRFMV